MNLIQKSILQTLIYSSLFDSGLNKVDLFKKLITPTPINKDLFNLELQKLCQSQKIINIDNFYYLTKYKDKTRSIKKKHLISKRKIAYLNKIMSYIRKVPYLRAVFLTGSVASQNASSEDDIDLLIICSKSRVWLCRLFLILITEIIGVRRRPQSSVIKNKLCFNIFLDENHLKMPSNKTNLFVATEILQLKPIFDKNNYYEKFLQDNRWVKKYYANFYFSENKHECFLKNNLILNAGNRLCYQLQLCLIKRKMTQEKINIHQAFFHPNNKKISILNQFESRKKSFLLV